jgi:chaperonin GroES
MAKMKMKPLGDNVIVKRLEADEVTAGGIYLPDSAKEKPKRGTVMAIGSGKLNDQGQRSAMQLKKNDQVLFSTAAA